MANELNHFFAVSSTLENNDNMKNPIIIFDGTDKDKLHFTRTSIETDEKDISQLDETI